MPPGLSFLDLSQSIRLEIYNYSGLIRSCPIELNVPDGYDPQVHGLMDRDIPGRSECLYDLRKSGGDRSRVLGVNKPDCLCPRLPIQLFLVSRAFYKDAFSSFYSSNKFVLRAQTPDNLRLLLGWNKHILSTLRSLLIRLNSWPCVRGHERTTRDGSRCYTCKTPAASPDYALNVRSSVGRDLLSGWEQISFYLASSIAPGQLKLFFICDVVDLDSGKALLEPLTQLPALKQCTIRLGRRPNYELSALAQRLSAQATHFYIRSQEPFPFKRLPRELRLLVLGYTHLSRHKKYDKSDDILRIYEGKLIKARPIIHLGNTCCRRCTETLTDCCCSATRAAYSTCICRRLPVALLLVDKEMRQDALAVLLKQNCFEFVQDPEMTIDFLSRFPKGSLQCLREIHFRFSETQIRRWVEQDGSRKWLALARFLKSNFQVSQLSIVVVAETYDLATSSRYENQERRIYDFYCDITRSLRTLGKLGSIRFDLGYFKRLGPLMSRAIVGEVDKSLYPDLVVSPKDRNRPDLKLPTWFRQSDLKEDPGSSGL